MTMQLILPPELELRLRDEATRRRVPAETCAVQLLEQMLLPTQRAAALRAMFDQWEAEDRANDNEADDDFFRALDDDRPSNRKLFPDELKGITW